MIHYGEADPDDEDETVIDQLLDHPAARNFLDQLDSIVSQVASRNLGPLPYPFPRSDDGGRSSPQYQGPGRAFYSDTSRRRPRPRYEVPPQAEPPPPPPRQPPAPAQSAREILHFGADEDLSREKIEKRRREIARLCHPDKGGSTRAMQRVNEAADELLAELG